MSVHSEIDLNPEVLGTFTAAGYYDDLAALRRDAPVRAYAPNSWTVARYDDVEESLHDLEDDCLEPATIRACRASV